MNQLAHHLVRMSTEDHAETRVVEIRTSKPILSKRKKNPAAVALGRLGGLRGGKARKEALTPEQRSNIASAAARARWAKKQ